MRTTTIFTALLLTAAGAASGQRTAEEIIDHVDRILRGESSRGVATMEVVTENWERNMTMEVWSLGTDHALIRITAPKKEEGTATLKAGNEIWNYLPRVDRTIKIPASMMMGAWMGSHFTNNDLVKESRMADDYTFELTYDGKQKGHEVVEVTCLPKPEAPVVWGKVVVTALKRVYLPINIKYYDEDFKLARIMSFSEVNDMNGRTMPTLMTIVPKDKPQESTIIKYKTIEFDLDLRDRIFSLRNLQR